MTPEALPQISFSETAYAKINLALHVRKRRDDGYHELETLFAFVDQGDELSFTEGGPGDYLRVTGEFADDVGSLEENLAWRAMQLDTDRFSLIATLDKRLPVAAGLGGGSADAGAALRAIYRFSGVRERIGQHEIAALGADVPACVDSVTCIGRGTGTRLEPVRNDLAGCAVLLVNPRTKLSTGPVFRAWDGKDRGALPAGSVRDIAMAGRNDLEEPAIMLCPQISSVLAALRQTSPMLARMSGSGATCFALYGSQSERDEAHSHITDRHPEWWTLSGNLR